MPCPRVVTIGLLADNCLVCRGSKPGASDNTGKTSLEIAVERGGIADEELFLMLSESNR